MQERLTQQNILTAGEPDRFANRWYRAGLLGSIVGLVYAISVVAYFGLSDAVLVDPVQTIYPGVWFGVLTAGLSLTSSRSRRSIGAILVSAGFVVWLFVVSGLLVIGMPASALAVDMAMPGWGPVVVLGGMGGSLTIVPFQTAGYVGLGVLLYRALGTGSSSVVPGIVSVFSCAGCLGWIGITLIGISGFSAAWVLEYSYPLATIAFITTVGLFSYLSRQIAHPGV